MSISQNIQPRRSWSWPLAFVWFVIGAAGLVGCIVVSLQLRHIGWSDDFANLAGLLLGGEILWLAKRGHAAYLIACLFGAMTVIGLVVAAIMYAFSHWQF